MVSRSRRAMLGSLATVLVGASGCTTLASPDRSTATPSATPSESERTYDRCLVDPPARRVRRSEGRPAIESAAHNPVDVWTSTSWVVDTPDEREALQFATDASGVEAGRAFVDGTDLSERSVLVVQNAFDECVMMRPKRLAFETAEHGEAGTFDLALEYEDVDPTNDCEDERPRYVEATLLRIPGDVEAVGSLDWATFPIGESDC